MADDHNPPIPTDSPQVQTAPSAVAEAPAPTPVAPPEAPPFSTAAFTRGLLRSAVHLLIGAAVGAVVGFLLNFVLFLVPSWTGDWRLLTGGGLLVGVFFNRYVLAALRLAPARERDAQASRPPADAPAPDGVRETVETVVFVLVLVLVLKSFDAEAFVIPTGSMAETLLGYQKWVVCPSCGYKFPANCSQQVDPTDGKTVWVSGCTCPNCRQHVSFVPHDQWHDSKPPATDAVTDPDWGSGDRVLVSKFAYDLLDKPPDRLDVVVFKFPGNGNLGSTNSHNPPFPQTGPFKDGVPMNYIKRLIGLPGETIAIHDGDLYVLAPGALPYDDLKDAPNPAAREQRMRELWQTRFMHNNEAVERFNRGEFQIVRKSPETLLKMRRIVYDNDHPARDLADVQPPRWADRGPGAGWAPDGANGFRLAPQDGGAEHLLSYQHLLRDERLEFDARRAKLKEQMKDAGLRARVKEKMKEALKGRNLPVSDQELDRQADPDKLLEDNLPIDLQEVRDAYLPKRGDALDEMRRAYGKEKPRLVTDFLGYNTSESERGSSRSGVNWVGDLILECDVQADQPAGELTLELSRGVDRFRARFDLATGACALIRDGQEKPLDSKPTALRGGGKHSVRFADVDRRLTLWVDDALPFGDGVAYEAPQIEGPKEQNDLEPAAVGLKGVGGAASRLRLWRDVYYSTALFDQNGSTGSNGAPSNDADPAYPDCGREVRFADPATWDKLRHPPTRTMYVQPGHYLCLGDNSPQSSDGRLWGLVPERLLLGKALDVYYPFDRFGRIR